MIEKLTDAQIVRFPEFVKKWTDIGLCTLPADRLRAEHGIRLAYETAKIKAPLKIVWTTSPLAQVLTEDVCLRIHKSASVLDSVRASVHASVHASVRASVRDSVHASVLDSVLDSVRDSVRDSVHASVRDSVRASVHASVLDSVLASVHASVRDSVLDRYYWWFGNGQHDAPWCAYVNFFREAAGLTEQTDKAEAHRLITESAGWFSPYTHICWITERHRRVCRNGRGQLHSHDGMAVEYPDGWGVWAWNGVRVNEQIILAPNTLTPKQIAKESNAQVRQVMVERVGIERVCQLFNAKSVDKQGTYELLVLDLGDGRTRPYLKMLNPSIGVWHVEGVHPSCDTVRKALNFRVGLTEDQIDDINGADWYEQGDVILKPKGVAKFKSSPTILT